MYEISSFPSGHFEYTLSRFDEFNLGEYTGF